MKAGRELDALVAEKVMGLYDVHLQLGGPVEDYVARGAFAWDSFVVPHYSIQIADAWRVVEKIRELPKVWKVDSYEWFAIEADGDKWIAGFKYEIDYEGDWFDDERSDAADTAPLAICLAALKAVGYEAA